MIASAWCRTPLDGFAGALGVAYEQMTFLTAAMLLSTTPPALPPTCPLTPDVEAALSAALGPTRPFVFAAGHATPIRRVEPLRAEWLSQAGHPHLDEICRPGQFFAFQIGVLARADIGAIDVHFGALTSDGRTVPASAARCLSAGGIDFRGTPFHKALTVPAGRLQPLWCGWDIPSTARGTYNGVVTVRLGATGEERVAIRLQVSGEPAPDHGFDDPASLTRLRWLDSTAGQGDSIPRPYVPVQVHGKAISVLGREVRLGQAGLPAELLSFFSSANTRIERASKAILAKPMRFVASVNGGSAELIGKSLAVTAAKTEASWTSTGSLGDLEATVNGRLDFTGSGQVAIRLTASKDMDLDDLRLEIPFKGESAKYLMGLNRRGGLRPASLDWNWDTKRHQDCFWLGDVNAGLMVRLKGANYRRPLVNIYYSFLPLALPESWGSGGVSIREDGDQVLVTAYTGSKHVRRGDILEFVADLYVTPFRTIDTEKQWATRFVHPHPSRDSKPLDDALASGDAHAGPNVVTVHQATYYNPYINYPYSPDSFAAFTDLVARAHEKGLRARVYYTTREITQNMPELFALHALNGEVIFPGPGKDAKTLINPNGPAPWLVANLGSDFVPAWVDHVGGKYAQDDISVITTPDSRWNNFYLEGLKWMVDKAKIDGIYIDDTALDAQSLLRARRILSARPNPLIDLHTWNHFNEYAGYANNLNMYMEVLPYLDRLWLGEGFPATEAAWDYWLVEMSGLPFGLMSEMLDSPAPIKGLVFGETGRLGWSGDPRPMWKVFDDFGIKGSEMLPFFSPDCPVRAADDKVKATVYRGHGKALVVLGNWTGAATTTELKIDWHRLGLNPGSTKATAPAIAGSQSASVVDLSKPLSIPKEGLVLELRG